MHLGSSMSFGGLIAHFFLLVFFHTILFFGLEIFLLYNCSTGMNLEVSILLFDLFYLTLFSLSRFMIPFTFLYLMSSPKFLWEAQELSLKELPIWLSQTRQKSTRAFVAKEKRKGVTTVS